MPRAVVSYNNVQNSQHFINLIWRKQHRTKLTDASRKYYRQQIWQLFRGYDTWFITEYLYPIYKWKCNSNTAGLFHVGSHSTVTADFGCLFLIICCLWSETKVCRIFWMSYEFFFPVLWNIQCGLFFISHSKTFYLGRHV